MKHSLGAEGRAALAGFVGPGALLAFDFDGTLAPIVPRPGDAAMRPRTRELLARLARRLPVIIVSGRGRADATRLLDGVAVMEVIGSHGVEPPAGAAARFAARVARWRDVLAPRVREFAGVAIENKKYSLAVHYRHAIDPAGAREAIGRAAGALEGARVVGGKAVVNVMPAEAPHKGAALKAACARIGCSRALYVGDDDTDDDVFKLGDPGWLFGVRVGEQSGSAAPWFLRGQEEIDGLLEAILEAAA